LIASDKQISDSWTLNFAGKQPSPFGQFQLRHFAAGQQ
jgi:hypothetical protein